MKCNCDKEPEFESECKDLKIGAQHKYYYDPETGDVYDERKQYIGKGTFEDGILKISRWKNSPKYP